MQREVTMSDNLPPIDTKGFESLGREMAEDMERKLLASMGDDIMAAIPMGMTWDDLTMPFERPRHSMCRCSLTPLDEAEPDIVVDIGMNAVEVRP